MCVDKRMNRWDTCSVTTREYILRLADDIYLPCSGCHTLTPLKDLYVEVGNPGKDLCDACTPKRKPRKPRT